ncbi:MAG: hypothetical protein P8L72_03715 [Flavobacteriaceae bacterium]|nr:hypothetical protein [Flavobacteriaceae bacterium]
MNGAKFPNATEVTTATKVPVFDTNLKLILMGICSMSLILIQNLETPVTDLKLTNGVINLLVERDGYAPWTETVRMET